AVATPLASPMVRVELPWAVTAHPVLVSLGLGLAVGFGLSHTSTAVVPGRPAGTGRTGDGPGPEPETATLVGLLVLGPAALVLSAMALAPVLLNAQMDTPYREPLLTVPLFAAGAAGLVALLFGLQRAMDRIRRELRAEVTSGATVAR
ncbi:hypothetical protein ACFQZ8_25655, partial [Micromonospora azadirachtae]